MLCYCLPHVFLYFSFHAAPLVRNWILVLGQVCLVSHDLMWLMWKAGHQRAHATGSRVNIYRYISTFVFRRFGVITGSVCTHLDRAGAWLLERNVHKENGRKQDRNLDAWVTDRRIGQQDDEGGEAPPRTEWRHVSSVSTQKSEGFSFFILTTWFNYWSLPKLPQMTWLQTHQPLLDGQSGEVTLWLQTGINQKDYKLMKGSVTITLWFTGFICVCRETMTYLSTEEGCGVKKKDNKLGRDRRGEVRSSSGLLLETATRSLAVFSVHAFWQYSGKKKWIELFPISWFSA